MKFNSTEIINSIPLSESDRLLAKWGFNLQEEYLSLLDFSNINPDYPVIDLATGSGRISSLLSRLNYRVFTGDYSTNNLASAKNRISEKYLDKISFIILNMEELPFRTNSINNIICLNTFHELSKPAKCLSEIIRIHSGEGKLVVSDFNEKGFEVMQRLHEIVYGNNHPTGSISMKEVEQLLKTNYSFVQEFNTNLNISFVANKKSRNFTKNN